MSLEPITKSMLQELGKTIIKERRQEIIVSQVTRIYNSVKKHIKAIPLSTCFQYNISEIHEAESYIAEIIEQLQIVFPDCIVTRYKDVKYDDIIICVDWS